MITTSLRNFEQNMASIMDKIEAEEAVAIINRPNGKHIVMMSLDEFKSWKETIYLMSSPANHAILTASMEEVKQGSNLIEVDYDNFMKVLDNPEQELERLGIAKVG